MAITRMKKLTVLAHADDADEVARRLMRCRCVDIVPAEAAGALDVNACEEERLAQTQKLARIAEALALLHKYNGKAPLVKLRRRMDSAAFRQDGRADEAWQVVARVEEIAAQLEEIGRAQADAEHLLERLRPWQAYDLPLAVTGTRRTRVVQGTFPTGADPDDLRDTLAATGVYAEFVSADRLLRYAVLIFHRDDADKLGLQLDALGFRRVSPAEGGETPAVEFARAERNLHRLRRQALALRHALTEFAPKTPTVEILADIEQTTLRIIDARARMAKTARCVVLNGWLPARAEQTVAAALARFDCAWEIIEPSEGDHVPILLQNNPFAANFEWVLGMYAYPQYGTFDPTFIMSIFYFLIFGLMFGDVGYGFLLALGCFGAIWLLKPRQGMRRFLAMFGLCGISSMLWGLLLGAYFGDLPKMFITRMLGRNPPARVALWFDPLEEPMTFLLLALAVGAVHLLGGMAVRFYLLCRAGKLLDALMDIGSWWLLFAGLALLAVYPAVGRWVLAAGVAAIVLTQGRRKRGLGKLFGGVAKLYGLVGYMSDLLSYSRILALGLASAVIAQVINILATLMGGTPAGYGLFLLVLPIGHGLNLVINVLGAFVHDSRLQYIEFFNKFYVDGGRAFQPLLPAETYSVDSLSPVRGPARGDVSAQNAYNPMSNQGEYKHDVQ